jgi:hypothetical protein
MGDGDRRASALKFLKFQLDLAVKHQIIVLLIVGNDLIWIEVSIFQFLVMAPTLKGVTRSYKFGHFFVELIDSE